MNNQLNIKITLPSLLRFTLPSIAMMVVMSLYTVVDGTFVSRLLNTNAFSAVNIVYPLLSIAVAVGTMFGTGLTAIVSRKLGEGKTLEARQNLSFTLLFTVGLGIVMSLICLLFLKDLLYLLGADDSIYKYCYDYAFPLVFFLPFSLLQLQFQTLFVADGKPQIGLITTIIGGVANVVLDYIFIAIFGMGIAGAAIATGIGYSLPAIYGIWHFAFKRSAGLHFVKPKADWPLLIRVMTNGSSEMVSNLSTSITTLLFNLIMMHYLGADGVAAIAIILYLDFVLIAISLGYSIGVAPLISYNYGKGDHAHLKKLFRLSTYFSAMIGIVMTVGTLLLKRPLSAIFAPEGSMVFELAVTGLQIFAFSYLFKCFNIFASALFTAYSNGAISALLSFMRTLVFLVGCLLGLTKLFGIDGVWFATPVAEILALALSLTMTWKYRKTYHYA